ncbi:hypothetical protein ACOSQ4_020375 [Xanthoceras sorbifolium]
MYTFILFSLFMVDSSIRSFLSETIFSLFECHSQVSRCFPRGVAAYQVTSSHVVQYEWGGVLNPATGKKKKKKKLCRAYIDGLYTRDYCRSLKLYTMCAAAAACKLCDKTESDI